MRLNDSLRVGLILLMTQLTVGCEKLGIGDPPPVADDGAPDAQQLKKISYMTADNTGVKGRKVYKRLEEAKSCKDLELALRWNRPPNVAGGPFKQKLVYLNQQLPADLPKNTEMFVAARIERGAMLPGGGAGWLLRMKDGSLIQAVESTDYWEKQEVDSQQGQPAAIVKPTKPGRVFCGHGVYQGPLAKAPDQNGNIPLVSMLFSMDRDK